MLLLTLFFPLFAYATGLININTADKVTLMELEGIGDTLANRIIEYRETNGPFSAVEELIHPNIERLYKSTFDKIKDHITVGDTSAPDIPDSTVSSTPSTTISTTDAVATPPSSSGKPPEYIPIPTLRLVTGGDRIVSSGADTPFTAVVYDNKGNKRDDAFVTWAFGDGMKRTGASVLHAYRAPGEYVAVVHASTPDGGEEIALIAVMVKSARVSIASVAADGISLENTDARTLDLSFWRLVAGGREFKIPADTKILAGRTILFPALVTGLSAADSAALLYPSGEVAALFPAIAPIEEQPSLGTVSYTKVSEVEPIQSARTDIQTYEDAVGAPAAATTLAAAGAALSPEPPPSRISLIFKSPWALGFLGVLILAGGAFIFL